MQIKSKEIFGVKLVHGSWWVKFLDKSYAGFDSEVHALVSKCCWIAAAPVCEIDCANLVITCLLDMLSSIGQN
jgi:hypothetical protein